jgi:hypoxanthine phosphoribosyltransferase
VPEPETATDHEILTWASFGAAVRELAGLIHDDAFRPDLILAIARGGLFAAGALGYALSVKNISVMNVEYYTGVDERLPVPVMLPPVPQFVHLDQARVLVADDVADTGHTLALVHEFCRHKVGDVRAAVLYQKPRSVIDCEYVWSRTSSWISFPWSSAPPVGGSGAADGAMPATGTAG